MSVESPIPSFEINFEEFHFQFNFSANDPIVQATQPQEEAPRPRHARMKSLLNRPQSWMPTSKPTAVPDEKGVVERETEAQEEGREAQDAGTETKAVRRPDMLAPSKADKPWATSSPLASLTKRGWKSTSKLSTPAPASKKEPADDLSRDEPKLTRLRKRAMTAVDGEGNKSSSDSRGRMGRIGTYIKRPQSVLVKGTLNDAGSTSSSVASLAISSTGTRPSASENSNTTVSEESARPHGRDPLWLVFKNLESDYTKFQAKPPLAKMNLVRTSLVPFLRNYASYPSRLPLLHLERRCVVLDQWWIGLLEMLSHQQAVAGVDRPALLEVSAPLSSLFFSFGGRHYRDLSQRECC
jgi:hypothetical protein